MPTPSATRMVEAVFVDTGNILTLVNENNRHHAKALVLSERYDSRPGVVTDAVLRKIGNALSRMDRAAAVRIIQDLRVGLTTALAFDQHFVQAGFVVRAG